MALKKEGMSDDISLMKAQARADHLAALMASEKRLLDERDELYKDVKIPDYVKTPQDHINYVRTKILMFGKKGSGKEKTVDKGRPKIKCLNCGLERCVRQYDKSKSTTENIVWLDEYECLDCKTRFVYG